MKKLTRKAALLSLAACLGTVCSALSITGAVADAKKEPLPPPLERYSCYQVHAASLTYTYMGYFILQDGHKYAWGFGKGKPTKSGRYTFGGDGLRFTEGPLKGIKGEFETEKNGRHTITLKIQGKKQYASDDGIITWYCNCDPHDPYNKKDKGQEDKK